MEQVHDEMRRRHYARRTEKAYRGWILRYVRFHGLQHPSDLGETDVRQFLSHLAVDRGLAASSQNQALNALVFLYRRVLRQELADIGAYDRATPRRSLPTVLSDLEVRNLFRHLEGRPSLVAGLQYGSGLRLSEALSLRVKDVDFDRHQLVIRNGKGMRQRVTLLPEALRSSMRKQVALVQARHAVDQGNGCGAAPLPSAFGRKNKSACFQVGWQFLFPASRLRWDPGQGMRVRDHMTTKPFGSD